MAKKDEQELLESYRGMTPENKANFVAYAKIAFAAQENARKSMGHKGKTAPAKSRRRSATTA